MKSSPTFQLEFKMLAKTFLSILVLKVITAELECNFENGSPCNWKNVTLDIFWHETDSSHLPLQVKNSLEKVEGSFLLALSINADDVAKLDTPPLLPAAHSCLKFNYASKGNVNIEVKHEILGGFFTSTSKSYSSTDGKWKTVNWNIDNREMFSKFSIEAHFQGQSSYAAIDNLKLTEDSCEAPPKRKKSLWESIRDYFFPTEATTIRHIPTTSVPETKPITSTTHKPSSTILISTMTKSTPIKLTTTKVASTTKPATVELTTVHTTKSPTTAEQISTAKTTTEQAIEKTTAKATAEQTSARRSTVKQTTVIPPATSIVEQTSTAKPPATTTVEQTTAKATAEQTTARSTTVKQTTVIPPATTIVEQTTSRPPATTTVEQTTTKPPATTTVEQTTAKPPTKSTEQVIGKSTAEKTTAKTTEEQTTTANPTTEQITKSNTIDTSESTKSSSEQSTAKIPFTTDNQAKIESTTKESTTESKLESTIESESKTTKFTAKIQSTSGEQSSLVTDEEITKEKTTTEEIAHEITDQTASDPTFIEVTTKKNATDGIENQVKDDSLVDKKSEDKKMKLEYWLAIGGGCILVMFCIAAFATHVIRKKRAARVEMETYFNPNYSDNNSCQRDSSDAAIKKNPTYAYNLEESDNYSFHRTDDRAKLTNAMHVC